MTNKDAFDRWWEWAEKPLNSMLTIDGDIHYPVTELSPEDQRNRDKNNEAVRRYRESRKDSPLLIQPQEGSTSGGCGFRSSALINLGQVISRFAN